MKIRKQMQYRESKQTVDGAGVHLNRVFWREDTLNIDPFLLLDMFDSTDPKDYILGFPMHPHRGIETFTYLISGEIFHKDSLGNVGKIRAGEYQWMNAGSGILHEEMPQLSEHMLGFQLWINLPKTEKMSHPTYLDGTAETILEVEGDHYLLRVLSGEFQNVSKKDLPATIPIEIYDIALEENSTLEIPVKENYNVLVAILQGEAIVCGSLMKNKSAGTFQDGDTVTIATGDQAARIIYFAGEPLKEPIAWGGPIVMNTQSELEQAYEELENGNFIKHDIN